MTELTKNFSLEPTESILINLEKIVKIDTWFNGGLHVELECGTKIEISRRQAIKFKDMFSI